MNDGSVDLAHRMEKVERKELHVNQVTHDAYTTPSLNASLVELSQHYHQEDEDEDARVELIIEEANTYNAAGECCTVS